jgi:SAM-dependent methyltransferase
MNTETRLRAAAYLRLSTTYRRALLNTLLQRWRHLLQGLVLDVGGEKGSRAGHDFQSQLDTRRYIYLNISPPKAPDVVGDGAHIPLRAAALDGVVCLETLEHVRDPLEVMRELARVLCAGGVLLLSVPFLYRIHSAPHDFWRFTEHQTRDMVQDVGLQIARLERIGLLFTVLCDMMKQAISEIHLTPLRWSIWLLFMPIFTVLVGLEHLGLGKHSTVLARFTTGYLVLATKPQGTDPPAGLHAARES